MAMQSKYGLPLRQSHVYLGRWDDGTHQPEPLKFIAITAVLKLFRVFVTDVAYTVGIHTGFLSKLAADTKILEI